MSHFVLELGTEELPARFLASLERELKEGFAAALAEADLGFDSLDTASTPRRAIIHVRGLAERQPLREEVVLGPSLKAAYGADGAPTKAARGFARGQGVDVDDLFTQETDKGVYVAARRTVGGAAALTVLEGLVPAVVAALTFPKRMRWGDGDFAFARPLRWVLALLDADIVPFSVGGVESGRQTYGHRVHGPGPFGVAHADHLDEVLSGKCRVTPMGAERRAVTVQGGDEQAARAGGRVLWKDGLLDEVQGLTEHPVPLLGDFDPSYLELPREVLLTSMDRDGTKSGYDLELTRQAAEAVNVPVIASGGAGKMRDFYDVLTEGQADAALAASLFHFGIINMRDLKNYLAERGVPVRREGY